MELPDELEIPRITRGRDRPESSASEGGVRIVQRRRVAHVERFGAKLEADSLRDPEHFADHDVGILKSRPADWIARAVADRELRRRREGGNIEPLRGAAVRERVRIADAVGSL